jgi:cobalamin biosynthesis protein CobT
VYGLDADKEEEQAQQAAKAKAAAGGKGDGGDKEKGEGDGAELFASMGKDGDKPRTEAATAVYKFFTEDSHEEFIEGKVKGDLYLKYEHDTSDLCGYTPTPWDRTYVIDYPAGKSNHHAYSATPSVAGTNRYKDVPCETDGFANKVRRLVQIRSKARMQYGTKKGALHPASAYRVVLKDAPGYNEKVFKKRIVSETLDSAIMILGDISGSMSGDKMEHQISAFMQLNQAIGNALHIPVALIGFTEHDRRNTMFVWRRFDDNALSNEKLKLRMRHSSQYMSQNCDGDSILYGYTLLKRRKEKRKILLVLSDGSPASSKGGDVDAYTRQLVKRIEADRSVDVYAIGILDDNVKRIYKNNRVIKNASELESALLSIIERKLT